jgi:hypothetical protein
MYHLTSFHKLNVIIPLQILMVSYLQPHHQLKVLLDINNHHQVLLLHLLEISHYPHI